MIATATATALPLPPLSIPEDRRSDSRSPLRYHVLVSPTRGEILDSGRNGIGLETTEPLAIGKETVLTVVGADGTRQRMRVRTRWCRLRGMTRLSDGSSAPLYRSGAELLPGPAE